MDEHWLLFLIPAGADIFIGGNIRAANVQYRSNTERVYCTLQTGMDQATVDNRLKPVAAAELGLPESDFIAQPCTSAEYRAIDQEVYGQQRTDDEAAAEAEKQRLKDLATPLFDSIGFSTNARDRTEEQAGFYLQLLEAAEAQGAV